MTVVRAAIVREAVREERKLWKAALREVRCILPDDAQDVEEMVKVLRKKDVADVIDIPEWAQFQVSLSRHPVYLDDHQVLRYKTKPIVRWLGDHIDLNEMWIAYQNDLFSCDELMQFYRDIGYSLGGFEEIWADELDKMEGGG